MTSKENYWWGYCNKDSIGWVLLDRTFNKPGQPDLYFVNCQKSEIYKESKENWNNPNFYVFENRFFEKLPQEQQKIFATQLNAFKIRIEEFKESLVVFEGVMKVEQFKKLRNKFSKTFGNKLKKQQRQLNRLKILSKKPSRQLIKFKNSYPQLLT